VFGDKIELNESMANPIMPSGIGLPLFLLFFSQDSDVQVRTEFEEAYLLRSSGHLKDE
jgi:hypothetical protein